MTNQNSAYLLKLHQYYDGIISELKKKIEMLEVKLAKSQILIENKRSELQIDPGTPPQPPYNKEENCSPVTIDFRFED